MGGKGRVSVFRDGQRYDGTWTADTDCAAAFKDKEGKPIKLAPGNTWFQVFPLDVNDHHEVGATSARCAAVSPAQVQSCDPSCIPICRLRTPSRSRRGQKESLHVADTNSEIGTLRVKTGLAEMLKGGVIMDVVNAEQAKIAEDAGAVAVMALERVPADIRAAGGVARMADPTMVEEIVDAVTIPVMAKCRIGHFVEAQVLQSLGVDYIDESEVLTPADEEYHVNKWDFTVPFVCGCRNLGEALRRIAEGAAMVRTKGEPGTGNVVEAVRHMRTVTDEIAWVAGLRERAALRRRQGAAGALRAGQVGRTRTASCRS